MYDRAIAKLKKAKLVEKHIWWFQQVPTLHLRPTKTTTDFIRDTKDKEWDEVMALLPKATDDGPLKGVAHQTANA
jgi:hypothetical protein